MSAPPVFAAPATTPSLVRPRVPDKPNTVSMFGAQSLGQWKRGQSGMLGFPLLAVRASIGLLDRLDVGLSFETMYGLLNDLRVTGKFALVQGTGFTLAASLETGGTFFTTRAAREVRGPRWITGRRNFALSPALIGSYQGSSPRSPRMFLTLRYLLAFDTEPFAKDPLSGVPSSLVLGHNSSLTIGAELPLSEKTSFVFAFGLEVHGRADDSPVMPTAQVGLTTGI